MLRKNSVKTCNFMIFSWNQRFFTDLRHIFRETQLFVSNWNMCIQFHGKYLLWLISRKISWNHFTFLFRQNTSLIHFPWIGMIIFPWNHICYVFSAIYVQFLLFLGFKVAEINGSIPVKERGGIVNDFNRVNAGKSHAKFRNDFT